MDFIPPTALLFYIMFALSYQVLVYTNLPITSQTRYPLRHAAYQVLKIQQNNSLYCLDKMSRLYFNYLCYSFPVRPSNP